jgi:hypothetical protein
MTKAQKLLEVTDYGASGGIMSTSHDPDYTIIGKHSWPNWQWYQNNAGALFPDWITGIGQPIRWQDLSNSQRIEAEKKRKSIESIIFNNAFD